MSLRIAIAGGGIAGMAVAALLGRRGHLVEVFERAGGAGGGAGLLLAPPALALLRAIGLEGAVRAQGAMVTGLRAKQACGATLLDWDVRRQGHECLGLGLQRRALHELLRQAAVANAVVHQGLGVEAVDADAGRIRDSSGNVHGRYDLIVACDGANSRLRDAVPALVARRQRYAWTAFSCLMRGAVGAPARTTLEQAFCGAHHVSSWPLGRADGSGSGSGSDGNGSGSDGDGNGSDGDGNGSDGNGNGNGNGNDDDQMICVSVNVPAASALRFSTADAGIAELQRLGLGLGAALQPLQAVGPWIALSCRDVALHRLYRGRLVFVGDAAHCLSPQLGQGARLALAGAVGLDLALSRHPLSEALAVYDRRQRALAAGYQRWSRWLTPLFQSQFPGLHWLRDSTLGRLSRLAAVEQGLLRLLCGPCDAQGLV